MDDPDYDCMAVVLYAQRQETWFGTFGWRTVEYERNGPKGIGSFGALHSLGEGVMQRQYPILDCQCTAMNVNNYGPPVPVPAKCDTYAIFPGWVKKPDAKELSCLDVVCKVNTQRKDGVHWPTGSRPTAGRHVTLDDIYGCADITPIYCDSSPVRADLCKRYCPLESALPQLTQRGTLGFGDVVHPLSNNNKTRRRHN